MTPNPAEVLRQGRKSKGMKQTEAAEKLGISQASISKIEAGEQSPGMDTISKMNEIYGLGLTKVQITRLYSQFNENDADEATTPEEKRLLRAYRKKDIAAVIRLFSALL